jgi:DNA repair photolyase
MTIREIQCKSVLSKTGLPADYAINCYVGCAHACAYCYARYMKRFTGHLEPWGTFVDVRVNAPEVLAKEVRRKQPASVILSSVCDGWQPLEAKYELSRRCVQILVEHEWHVSILTKSALVRRDLPLLERAGGAGSSLPMDGSGPARPSADLGMTITTLDDRLSRIVEPGASTGRERLEALRDAAARSIEVWAFLGPFLPGLTDTHENLEPLIAAVATLPLSHVYTDRVNFRSGVASSLRAMARQHFPHLVREWDWLGSNADEDRAYADQLHDRIAELAEQYGLLGKIPGFSGRRGT